MLIFRRTEFCIFLQLFYDRQLRVDAAMVTERVEAMDVLYQAPFSSVPVAFWTSREDGSLYLQYLTPPAATGPVSPQQKGEASETSPDDGDNSTSNNSYNETSSAVTKPVKTTPRTASGKEGKQRAPRAAPDDTGLKQRASRAAPDDTGLKHGLLVRDNCSYVYDCIRYARFPRFCPLYIYIIYNDFFNMLIISSNMM